MSNRNNGHARSRAVQNSAAQRPAFSPMVVRAKYARIVATTVGWQRNGNVEVCVATVVLSDGRTFTASDRIEYGPTEREKAMDALVQNKWGPMTRIMMRRCAIAERLRAEVTRRYSQMEVAA